MIEQTRINQKLEDVKVNNEEKLTDVSKKTEAIVTGRNLSISTKQAVAVCNFIRNKEVDKAIGNLEKVSKMKIAVPMKGEIPHRKGKIMSGRYPIKTVNEFIKLIKSLKANAILNELELEKFKIFCMANQASRPYKRFGQGRMKRCNIVIKLIPIGEK